MNHARSLFGNRRLTVSAFYLSLAAIIAMFALTSSRVVQPFVLACLIVFAVSFVRLAVITKPYSIEGLRWTAPPRVDERQSRVRDHALAYSYWVTSTLLVLLTLWVSASQLWPAMWHPRSLAEWLRALWVIISVTSMLPAAIIAWNEPKGE